MNVVMVTAIQAVVRTMASDPTHSSSLLRRLLEPAHVAKYGHEELSWLAREIKVIAGVDPELAVAIYAAAYGFVDPDGETPVRMGDSQILGLTTNRRQNYQMAWHALSEALPDLLRTYPEVGVRSATAAIGAYVERAQQRLSGEPDQSGTFPFGVAEARYKADQSYQWFRGGFLSPQDGPALYKKFDEFLSAMAASADAVAQIKAVIETLKAEAGNAVFWASLLNVGAKHPELARLMLPLVVAPAVLTGWDTRPSVGVFLSAAYQTFNAGEREGIEHAILGLSGKAGEDAKKRLAGTLPEDLIATEEMRTYRQTLAAEGAARPNTPITNISTSWRAFDTDAYLTSEGVDVADPTNASLRVALKSVEQLPPMSAANGLGLGEVAARIAILEVLQQQIDASRLDAADPRLSELAEGSLAEGASAIVRFNPALLAENQVRRRLEAILLVTSGSANPHPNPEVEADFNENLSWGGPSARTASADGLIRLAGGDRPIEPAVVEAIRRLARDPVCHVRLHIVQHLNLLAAGAEREWMWSELDHVVANEPTRGVVGGAVEAVSALAGVDAHHAIMVAKAVLTRYADQTDPGYATVAGLAATFIADLHFWDDQAEADEFVAAKLSPDDFASGLLGNWIARHSGNLLAGDPARPDDPQHRVRQKTLNFYSQAVGVALGRIEAIDAGRGSATFGQWSEENQAAVRAAFDVVGEVALRLSFGLGAHAQSPNDDSQSSRRERLYRETDQLLDQLADTRIPKIAHDLIQGLEAVVDFDPAGVFAKIAKCVRASALGGYAFESLAATLIVSIVELYLAEYRDIFAETGRLNDLVDTLDVFARAGWPEAQALTFRLAEIWR